MVSPKPSVAPGRLILGPGSARTRGHRLSDSAAATARSGGALGDDAGRPGAERRGKDDAAQIDAGSLAASLGQARAATWALAAGRLRPPARPPRPELAAVRAGRGPHGPHAPVGSAAALSRTRQEARVRSARGDRRRRAGAKAAVHALRRPAPARAHRAGDRRRAGAARAR